MNTIIDTILTNSLLIHRHISGRKNSLLSKVGISRNVLDVLMLIHHAGQISGKDLAGMLGISTSAITQSIDHLVGDNLVERVTHSQDRRITLLQLSALGKAKLEQITAHHGAILNTALSKCTVEELEILSKIQEKMLNALQINSL